MMEQLRSFVSDSHNSIITMYLSDLVDVNLIYQSTIKTLILHCTCTSYVSCTGIVQTSNQKKERLVVLQGH